MSSCYSKVLVAELIRVLIKSSFFFNFFLIKKYYNLPYLWHQYPLLDTNLSHYQIPTHLKNLRHLYGTSTLYRFPTIPEPNKNRTFYGTYQKGAVNLLCIFSTLSRHLLKITRPFRIYGTSGTSAPIFS